MNKLIYSINYSRFDKNIYLKGGSLESDFKKYFNIVFQFDQVEMSKKQHIAKNYSTVKMTDHKTYSKAGTVQEYIRNKIMFSCWQFVMYIIAIQGNNPYKIIGYLSHGAGYYINQSEKIKVLESSGLSFKDVNIEDGNRIHWIYNKPILEDILIKFKNLTKDKYNFLPTNAEEFIKNIINKHDILLDETDAGRNFYKKYPLLECLVQRLFGEGKNSLNSIFTSNESKKDCYKEDNIHFWKQILPPNNLSVIVDWRWKINPIGAKSLPIRYAMIKKYLVHP